DIDTFRVWQVALIGAALSIISQFGDLAFSAIKRSVGIKDFGTILPGHGGVLDRFDSMAFVIPSLYCIIVLFFV
nr:phosphatidate cytidylyltransferase [Clostridia bacterium]